MAFPARHALLYVVRLTAAMLAFSAATAVAFQEDGPPIVPEGFAVEIVAKEPLVRNPCAMAFDSRGRICIGQGPQYRNPTPNTPGDRVDILIDDDGDGVADRSHTFAEGFNCIQGLAWRGRDLWVANAPDLTVVRDLDGDDVADEYIRIFTDLGNLEHGVHGLNFGPDGKLYMSKGNSKGYNRPDHYAPKAFRDLWGLATPEGAADYTPIKPVPRAEYRRAYHNPADDWGQQGGVLRCDPDGRNLEIVAAGNRNPWDITFDDGFNWLGTDNDQAQGDKIFSPFFGAHFGWGHSWSYHWSGSGHLPSVPASAPLFEGSGTGVIFYQASHFPPQYQNAFFVNDWLRREIYLFRPAWDGALFACEDGATPVFAHAEGGRSLPKSTGRAFDPTDIEVGPDGALYVLSWGHAYGAVVRDGKQTDIGRVYRLRYVSRPLQEWSRDDRIAQANARSFDSLFDDLGSWVPIWRVDAQEEFVRRGRASIPFLTEKLNALDSLSKAQVTWTLWTLGRLAPEDSSIDERLANLAKSKEVERNARIQAIRILGFRIRQFGKRARLPEAFGDLLTSSNPRLRHETVQAIGQARDVRWTERLLALAGAESDRITFYSVWNVLRSMHQIPARKSWLTDSRGGVRLAALLGLLEDDALTVEEVGVLRDDSDPRVSEWAATWLEKTGGAPLVEMTPPPGEYAEPVRVVLRTQVRDGQLAYTLDGSTPTKTSPRYSGPIPIDRDARLRVTLLREGSKIGRVAKGDYRIGSGDSYSQQAFVFNVAARSGLAYRVDWSGLAVGKRQYTDRQYRFTKVPAELIGVPILQTANDDDHSRGDEWLSFESREPLTVMVAVDTRCNAPLTWMGIGKPGEFSETNWMLATDDSTFRVYRKDFPAGRIVLGGNSNSSGESPRGNYAVLLHRPLIHPRPDAKPATVAETLAALKTANTARGRDLFLHQQGAGCYKCHRIENRGSQFAPDLSDIGTRVKDPKTLIESILTPSAAITEGFAQQQIRTVDGKSYSGAVLEETGRSLKLVSPDVQVTTILKKDIEERIGTKISPMPDGFGKLMSPQQIADLTAWMMTLKSVGDPEGFSIRQDVDSLQIRYGRQTIATYLKRHPELTRRGLIHVTTPGGIQVTRNFPPRKPVDIDPGFNGKSGGDHALMHPGIWMGFGDLDGHDYWRLKAKVQFDGFSEAPTANKEEAAFVARNLFRSTDGKRTVCVETTRYRFRRIDEGLMVRLDATYQSDERDFYFGDQEESGLGVRVASQIRVEGGNGTILNDRGERNGAAVWGKEAKWSDYSGQIGDRRVGVMVVPSPKNPWPSWLHARDYGVIVTNPFPKQPRERRDPFVKTRVKKGQPFRLSYAILIHDLPRNQALDHEAAYKKALQTLAE